MCLAQLTITSNIRDYHINFEKDGSFIKQLASRENSVFVIDEKVWQLYSSSLLCDLPKEKVILQKAKENLKNIESVCHLYEKIMDFSPRKNMTLVSIGGGIIQDITGFVASTLYRGINWIFVPTTLLAQVDSCIGAKTSLNFKHFKNLIGSFYPPSQIYLYPGFLNSLSEEDFYSGVGEMAKLHLMDGSMSTQKFQDALSLIEERDVQTLLQTTQNCLRIKKSYIEDDEFDTGKRNLLNYGHCFGHAVESATDFAVPHGQAVVLGMILANKTSVAKGILSPEKEENIRSQILNPVLKVKAPHLKADEIVTAMRQDKKNTGQGLALIMLEDDGKMRKIVDLKEYEAAKVISETVF